MRFRHPKGLYLLFTVEMWERFSYYGMRALLIFYLTKSWLDGGLGYDEQTGNLIYGFFTGFVYFTPLIGGWLADHKIGQRMAISIGAFTMMAGEFCLASSQSRYSLMAGLILLIIGNGFFKPNISTIVGQLYSPTDHRRDQGFTLFYMGINVGALFSPLVTGTLAVHYGYNTGFLAAGIGMLIGQIFYLSLGNRLLGNAGKRLHKDKSLSPEASTPPLTKVEKDRTKVILITTFFAIFFFASFEQAGSSLSLYTDKFIDRTIGNFEIPASWFQSVNPICIILFAPLFSILWRELARRKREPSLPVKMASGMLLQGLGFVLMVGAVLQRGDSSSELVKANILWMLFMYLFSTFGELCLSPIGLSMVSRLSPARLTSMLMGVWLASSFVANILAGQVAAMVGELGALKIFGSIAAVCFAIGGILLLLSRRLVRMEHHDEA
ncbi:MAG: peptide MFS transporter [Paludibacteraceae bacterium]|nr:peptide MFS transporter [Paludibacteraceae bacterium]